MRRLPGLVYRFLKPGLEITNLVSDTIQQLAGRQQADCIQLQGSHLISDQTGSRLIDVHSNVQTSCMEIFSASVGSQYVGSLR